MTIRTRLTNAVTSTQAQTTAWIPESLRDLFRRMTGGDRAAAQLLRGLLWKYRLFVSMALGANIASAFFEGSTMAIFTLALELLAGEVSTTNISASDALGTLGQLTNRLQSQLGTTGFFFLLVGLAVVTQILRSGLDFLGKVATSYLTAWLEGDLRRRIFRQLMALSFPAISRYKTGDLVSYNDQVTNVGNMVIQVNGFVNHLTVVLAYSVVLLWLSWSMTLAAIVALVLLSLSLRGIIQRVRNVSQKFVTASVTFNEQIVEYLRGLRLVHTFQQQDHAVQSVEQILGQAIRARRQGLVWGNMIAPIVQSLTVIGVAIFLALGYVLVLQSETGIAAIPRMVTFVFILYRLLPRITVLNNSLAGINNAWPFANRIAVLLRSDDKQYTHAGSMTFDGLTEKIDFQAVSLTYPESDQPALQKLSLTIPRGTMTAFVGTSGAGKSTLVSLLLRLYEPTDGQILVDRVNLSDYQLETWRDQIGVVDQDTFVFNRSIADNIRFGKLDATQTEIEEAAQIAHAHDVISALPDGYETVVGDRGYRLSGGQRQRIAMGAIPKIRIDSVLAN